MEDTNPCGLTGRGFVITSATSAGAEANYFVLLRTSTTKLPVDEQPAEVITRGTDRVQASGKSVQVLPVLHHIKCHVSPQTDEQ